MLAANPISRDLMNKQLQMQAQSHMEQARFYKTAQHFDMALVSYGQAKVIFKHLEDVRQQGLSFSKIKNAFSQAHTPQTPEDESLRQRIAEIYVERAEVLKSLGKLGKAQKSDEKARAWGYEGLPVTSTMTSLSSSDNDIGLNKPVEFFPARASLAPSFVEQACPRKKHQWVAQVFETILKQFQDLDLCQSSPSLFLVYAHNNNQLGKADAEVSQRVIQWLSNLRSNLYSDRSAGGHQALPFSATLEEKAKANDILSSQLCLLPNHAGTVDHVVLCGSELLGHYMASPYYERFYESIQRAYQEANDFTQAEAAMRKVVDANLNEKEFHHVLTELAFLQIRYEHNKDKHGTIPLLLNSTAQQCLPKFIIDSTTIRIEDSIWRMPNLWNGQQTYQDEGLHIGFFKLLKRLLVKQEGHIALVEEKIYQACLNKLREDHAHALTAEAFSLFLNQACVAALDALKKDGASDLREVNVQRAYESLRTEIKQIRGEALIAPNQLHSALAASYAAKNLDIQRLSGPALSMEHCYINLVMVEHEKNRKEEKEAKEERLVLEHFHRLPSFEAIDSNQQKLVQLDKIFEPRELNQGKKMTPKRILIRGRAGVGKTTLSKKIVYEYTQKGQWRDRFDHVLWISLRTLKGKQSCNFETLLYEIYFQHHAKGLALAKMLNAQINGPAKEKNLFILDGWDEVAQEWSEHEPMSAFLTQLLNHPAVLITSRPYVDLKQAPPMDLELETVGFSPENVMAYLDNRAMMPVSQAQEMKQFIQTTPFIQGLVNVPIQLDALCYSWDEIKRLQQGAQGSVTVTSLYQAMINKLWRKDMLRLGKREGGELLTESQVNALERPSRIEKLVRVEQDFLSTLAFRGWQRNQIEFSHRDLHVLIEQLEAEGADLPLTLEDNLKKLSFLHADNAEERQHSYCFMHSTFQEFFAAKHIAQCWETGKEITLLSVGAERWTRVSADAFVRQHKYNPRYETVWWFVSGLLRAQALNRFVDSLEAEPRDLFGAAHQCLMTNCLHEASRSPDAGLSPDTRDRLMQHLAQWLQFEIYQTGKGTLAYQSTFPEHLLLEFLKETASAKTKRAVASTLGHRSALSEAARQALIALTKDEDKQVRCAAVDALGQQSSLPPEAIQALIALAKDKDKYVNHAAASALCKQSSVLPDALQALIALAEDKDEYFSVKSTVVFALGQHSSSDALQALIALAKDGSETVRHSVAFALGKQSPLTSEALPALSALAKDEDWEVRRAVADALSKHSSLPPKALKILSALAKDETVSVMSLAIFALGQQSSPEAVLALIALAKNKNEEAKYGAADALGKQFPLPLEAVLALIALATNKNEDKYVRSAVASALGQQSSPEALLALIELAKNKNEDKYVRSAAADALGKQSSLPLEAVLTLIALATNKNEYKYVRSAAASALGRQSSLPLDAFHAMVALARDEDRNVRDAAADGLGQQSLLPPETLQGWIALLKDEDRKLRSTAASALGQQSSLPPEAFPALIALATDKAWYVKSIAAKALGQHSSPEALQALCVLAKDEVEEVRRAAADALDKHRWTLYRSLPTLNGQQIALIYKGYLLPQSFDQSVPFYIQDGALCFYNVEGLQTVPFNNADNEMAFKQAIQQAQQTVGISSSDKKLASFLIR